MATVVRVVLWRNDEANMRKSMLISILLSLAWPAQAERDAVAKWDCFRFSVFESESDAPVVTVWIYADEDVAGNSGKIFANGITKSAKYSQQGIEHRWDFDPKSKWLGFWSSYESAFVIGTEGRGSYYHFGAGDKAKASLITKCKKTL